MADTENKPGDGETPEGNGAAEGKSKSPLKLLGAVLGLIVTGTMAAFMALPSKGAHQEFDGPFAVSLTDEKVTINLRDNDGKRYLQLMIDCMYFAYDPGYLTRRQSDPMYHSLFVSAINRLGASKYFEEVNQGAAREGFMEELRATLDPILFPVHVGNGSLPYDTDSASGLRTGVSSGRGTFRGRFHDHVLHVDASAGTIRLDEGEEARFEGHEQDLVVSSPDGRTIYVDVSQLEKGFAGEVKVGVHGMIRQLVETEYLFQ